MKTSISYYNSSFATYIWIAFNAIGVIGSVVAYYFIPHWIMIIPGMIYAFYLFKLLKRSRDNEIQLELSEKSIYLKPFGIYYWDKVDYMVFRSTGHPSHELNLIVNLNNANRHDETELVFDCVPLNVSENKLRDAINQFAYDKLLQA